MYDYFYGPQANLFNFIRIPVVLFSKEEFKCLSPEAKILYGILLRRMDLSARNGRQAAASAISGRTAR